MYIPVNPVSKPRMTQSDKWKQRPAVLKYRQFKDDMRLHASQLQNNVDDVVWLIFVIEMPKSWSKKKRAEMLGKPHQQTPDFDNLTKAFLDATMKEDKAVHQGHIAKYWGKKGGIYYGKEHWDGISKATKEKEERPSPEQKQEKLLARVGRQGNPRLRGVSPGIRRR